MVELINAVICSYKSGDVIKYTLNQLIESPDVTKILIADGPHKGEIKPGFKADSPTVKEIVEDLNCSKIHYEYTDHFNTRSQKVNNVLKQLECKWVLNVDSDEVYHEDGLKRLVKFLKSNPEYDRYKIRTINPYPDFFHEFKIPDWKPRLYKYYPGCGCDPKNDRLHQYILHPDQKQHPDEHRGVAKLSRRVAEIYHLNALRGAPAGLCRVHDNEDGTINYKGGGSKFTSKIYPIKMNKIPKSIIESNRKTLKGS